MPTGSPKAAAAAPPPPQPEREQVAGGGAAGAGEVFLAGQGAPRERGKGQRRPSEESIITSSPREGWTRFCYSMFSSACALGLGGGLGPLVARSQLGDFSGAPRTEKCSRWRSPRSPPPPCRRRAPMSSPSLQHRIPAPSQLGQIGAGLIGPFFGSAEKPSRGEPPLGPAQASPNTLNTHDTQITIRHS